MARTTNPYLHSILVSGVICIAVALVVSARPPVVLSQNIVTASIEGRVVKRGTNEPIAGVDLELDRVDGTSTSPLGPGVSEAFASILFYNSPGLPAQGATPPPILLPEVRYAKSGDDGRFAFKDLKEGKYRLAAVRNGGMYYPAELGQRDPKQRGLSFPIAAGQAMKDVKLEMALTGAIEGRVVDEDGQPLGHAVVLALTAQFRGGEQRAYIERQALTDESGNYRLYWLGPGRYYVAAVYEDPQRRTIEMAPTAPPGRTIARERATAPVITRQSLPDGSVVEEAYGVVYYGGVMDLRRANVVDVRSGETFSGADIPMGAGKMRAHHIRGTVVFGETGMPASGAQVRAIPIQERPNALVLTGTTNSNGAFDLAGAISDGYVLTATSSVTVTTAGNVTGPIPAGAQVIGGYTSTVGYVRVEIGDADMNNIRIVTSGGITLPGHIVIEGKSQADASADLAKMSVGLTRDPDLIAMPSALMPLPAPLAGTPPPAVRPPGNGQVVASGDFKIFVSPGDFRMNVDGIPANTYVKSIRMGGDDILRSGLHIIQATDNPLQIVIGTDGGTLSGTVVDETLGPFLNATVALVPDTPDRRGRPDQYRNTTTDSTGNFHLTAIPPGGYKLFAWEWAETDSWENADFIFAFENLGKSILVPASAKLEKIQLNVIRDAKGTR